MARYEMFHSHASMGASAECPPMEGLLKTGLRKAFPLPAKRDATTEEKFQQLLESLATRSQDVKAQPSA